MIKREIKAVLDGIKKINTGKFDDKKLAEDIFKNFFTLVRLQREYEADMEAIRSLFLDEFKDEQRVVMRLESDYKNEIDPAKKAAIYKEIKSHTKYTNASDSVVDKLEALGKDDVKVIFIDPEKFWEQYKKQDFDLAVVEAIAPLFEAEPKRSQKKG